MKENTCISPELEVIQFETEDVITTSTVDPAETPPSGLFS